MDNETYKKLIGVQDRTISWVGHDEEECRFIVLLDNNMAISVPEDEFTIIPNASEVLSKLLEAEELHASQVVALKTRMNMAAYSKGFGDGYEGRTYSNGMYSSEEQKANYDLGHKSGQESKKQAQEQAGPAVVADGGANVTVTINGQDAVVVVPNAEVAEGADGISP